MMPRICLHVTRLARFGQQLVSDHANVTQRTASQAKAMESYVIRRQQRHPNRDPTPLTGSQHERLLHPQLLHDL